MGFDGDAAVLRADFFVGREKAQHREGQRRQLLQRHHHKALQHQAGLHVGHAGAVAALAVHAPGPLGHGAGGEHGVAVAHQHHRRCRGLRARQAGQQHVALGDITAVFGADARGLQPARHGLGHAVGARLVVAAGVDVDQRGQGRLHGGALAGQPFGGGAAWHLYVVRHGIHRGTHAHSCITPAPSSARSQNMPAMICSDSRVVSTRMCSFGACWEQAG